jgi:hypothetical protein
MIKEFALQPEALVESFQTFRYLIEKFGVGHGRLISEFPSKWAKLVYEALNAQSLADEERHAISAYFKAKLIGQPDFVYPSQRPGGDGQKDWVDRAIEASSQTPFDGIIVSGKTDGRDNLLSARTLTDLDPQFASKRNFRVDRTADQLVGCIDLLIRASQSVKLIDPYLNPKDRRWRRVIEAVANRIQIRSQRSSEIEIFRSYDGDIQKSNLLRDFGEWLPKCSAQEGIKFRVFMFSKQDVYMHNRFILTNIGGAMYGTGLDEWDDASPKAPEDVALLDYKEFALKWAQYSGHPIMLEI